jgi:hypothetical protein
MRRRAPALTLLSCCSLFLFAPSPAGANSFLFVDAPRELPASRAALSMESGYEHRGIRDALDDAAVYRLGLRWPLTRRLETIVHLDVRGGASSATTAAELHARWTAGRSTERGRLLSLSAGGRQEDTGITTLLGSVAGSIPLGQSRVAMSANIERPLSEARDEFDLLTSAGWMKSFGSRFEGGIELSGQDLEGFWSEEEAEGGATLFAGPTISVRGLRSPWRLSLGGGPVFHATTSPRSSGAPRPIPTDRSGYALRLALRLGEAD